MTYMQLLSCDVWSYVLIEGRIAMVTMQSWMFLRSFADLRVGSDKNNIIGKKNKKFQGLLRETCVESLAHLGSNAFEEINGDVSTKCNVYLKKYLLINNNYHQINFIRLINNKKS